MNDLMENICKIHTTELGIIRIKKNLEIETNDVVNWCKNKTKNADNILRRGKKLVCLCRWLNNNYKCA